MTDIVDRLKAISLKIGDIDIIDGEDADTIDEGFLEIIRLRRERDEARAALIAVHPYLDAIVCYASTIDEHDGNRVAAIVNAALPTPEATK